MALAINDTAPDFEAQTTEGKIKFHDWIGNSWAVLFSHPKDFTPVCTTELGYMAKIKPEFEKRGVKIIGLSVDPVAKHLGWSEAITQTPGAPTSRSRSCTACCRPACRATRPSAPRPTTRRSATCSSSVRTRRSS